MGRFSTTSMVLSSWAQKWNLERGRDEPLVHVGDCAEMLGGL